MSNPASRTTPNEPVDASGAGALIIIPTYEERDNLPRLVDAIFAVVPKVHLLIVDDNSPDGTGQLADALAAKDGRVHVMHRAGKLGLGTAYIAGFKWALGRDYHRIFEMDCDFSHQPKYLADFLQASSTADLVLGCRYMKGGGTEDWTWFRRFVSKGGNFYARAVMGLRFRDLTGGFKCFRREVLEAIDLDAVKSKGYAFQIELTYRAHLAGFRIAEVPIIFPDRKVGQSKMSGRIVREAMINVVKLRLSKKQLVGKSA
ncbi:MAG: polyprenol monophosphomannose synthase [Deltaproteobacteria bacterium]|jgi:dolichol-phosphate mannosyltransferase|nr:polyprenol monophosphomannose synthase [Deltaproteobacteria bacterium]